jgi:hypothetical protein
MEWSAIISGIMGSAASGGLLGIFGSLLGGVFKYFQTRQQQQFEKEKWKHELDLHTLDLQRSREEDEHELAVISQQGAWQGLGQSIQADAAYAGVDTYKWSKTIKELYRPFFTTVIFVFVWIIFNDLMKLIQGNDSSLSSIFIPGEAKELLIYIIHSVVFTACTAGLWWFGDRAFAPPGMKNR